MSASVDRSNSGTASTPFAKAHEQTSAHIATAAKTDFMNDPLLSKFNYISGTCAPAHDYTRRGQTKTGRKKILRLKKTKKPPRKDLICSPKSRHTKKTNS
jgi:hypothetical protein